MLVYVGTIMPYRLAFIEYRLQIGDVDSDDYVCITPDLVFGWEVWDYVVDGFFWFDLFFNFVLSYPDKYNQEITDPGKIAINYITGYFIVNIMGCFPGNAFLPVVEMIGIDPGGCGDRSRGNDAARLLRLQRVSRLVRLARLIRVSRYFADMQESMNEWMQEIIKRAAFINLILGLVWIVHVLSCGWYICAAMHYDHSSTWVARRTIPGTAAGHSLLDEPPQVQWIHSMYVIFTVFTTVGFGDVSAQTVGECLYIIFVMLVGAIVHSIIIGNVINIVSKQTDEQIWRQGQKSLLTAFGHQTFIEPREIYQLTKHIDSSATHFQYDRQELRKLLHSGTIAREMLGRLPDKLFKGFLMRTRFIATCQSACYGGALPPRFSLLLSTCLTQQYFSDSEIIVKQHDSAMHIYIVMSGVFAAIGDPGTQGGGDAIVSQSHFENMPFVRENVTRSSPKTVKDTLGAATITVSENAKKARQQVVKGINQIRNKQIEDSVEQEVTVATEIGRRFSSHDGLHFSLHVPDPSRLGQKNHAWVPATSSHAQWLEVDLGRPKLVSGVRIAGHPRKRLWVTSFTVITSLVNDFDNEYVCRFEVKSGCFDNVTEVDHDIPAHMTRFIRIVPRTWNENIGLRCGILSRPLALYPYKIWGSKNYFGDELFFSGLRKSTVRCEHAGEALLLHKRDLIADDPNGARLFADFPQFQKVLVVIARRREQHRLRLLRKLTTRHLRHGIRGLAAVIIQDFFRRRAKRRRKRTGDYISSILTQTSAFDTFRMATANHHESEFANGKNEGSEAEEVSSPRSAAASWRLHPRNENLSQEQKINKMFKVIQEMAGKMEGLQAGHFELAGQLDHIASRLDEQRIRGGSKRPATTPEDVQMRRLIEPPRESSLVL
jgi:CRP-like cAMP-binding protein